MIMSLSSLMVQLPDVLRTFKQNHNDESLCQTKQKVFGFDFIPNSFSLT